MRPLGSGGSGSVWLALDERNGLDVALKIIPREGKAAARAEREALAARRLRHERCVRAYDVGHDGSHVYIAYEYVPGRTLREAIRAGALSDRDAVEVAAQMLDALAHAHRAGIVHRDVKPANILVEDRDELATKLLDFGLAQFDGADTLTAVGDVPGTLAYIAPERLAGGEATPESDVWSVGVLLWETLTDRHPFWGVPIQEVARAIQEGAPPLATERRDLPRRLAGAVDAALSLDPAARPTASMLAAELRNALRSSPSRPARKERSTKQAEETLAPAQRHARRVVPVALGVVTAVLGATLLPFWPPELVVALALGTAIACWFDPRLGMAAALATPVFPLGNVSASAATLYGVFAVGWVVLNWRDARHGLLFVSGPLLAGDRTAAARAARPPARAGNRASSRAGRAGRALGRPSRRSRRPPAPGRGRTSRCGRHRPAHTRLGMPDSAYGAGSRPIRRPSPPPYSSLPRRRSCRGPGASRHSALAAIGFALTAASVVAGASVASTVVVLLGWAVAGGSTIALRRVS